MDLRRAGRGGRARRPLPLTEVFSLRENVTSSRIPFIFLTASNRTYARQWGVELGADDYLTKPFRLEQLLDAIRRRLAAS